MLKRILKTKSMVIGILTFLFGIYCCFMTEYWLGGIQTIAIGLLFICIRDAVAKNGGK
jgi:hypothetical protein